MADKLIYVTAFGGRVRASVAETTKTVGEALRRHKLSPLSAVVLGRALTAVALMSAFASDSEIITLQIECTGPAKLIVVEATPAHTVRGYISNPCVEPMLKDTDAGVKWDVAKAVGSGTLYVIRDMGLKAPFIGQVELVSGEIGKDLAYYYAKSEQIPSAVGLGVLVDRNGIRRAGGFIVQAVAPMEERELTGIEERVAKISSFTRELDAGRSPWDILKGILSEGNPEIHGEYEVRFACRCSKERAARAAVSLGKKDIEEHVKAEKPLEVTCVWCGERYVFSVEELRELLKQAEEGGKKGD